MRNQGLIHGPKRGRFPILLTAGLLLLSSFACKNETPELEEVPPTAEPVTTSPAPEPTSEPMDTNMSTGPTSDLGPVDNEAVKAKVSESIHLAKNTYEQLSAFRETMFSDSYEQFQSILCSTYRLERLSLDAEHDFYKRDPDLYIGRLQTVLRQQSFLQLDQKESEETAYDSSTFTWVPSKTVKTVQAIIPKSEPYQNQGFGVVRTVRSVDTGFLSEVSYTFDPVQGCTEEFLRPIPGFGQARSMEKASLAALIVRAVHRLDGYKGKLDLIEVGCSKATLLELHLTALQKNMAIDSIDPTVARDEVRVYEGTLREAIDLLKQVRPEVWEDHAVSGKEINAVLAIFR